MGLTDLDHKRLLLADMDELWRMARDEGGVLRDVAFSLLCMDFESLILDAIMDPEKDSYPNHPGRKGGGSLPKGSSPAEMRKRAKENPNVRNGLDGDDVTFPVYGFRKGKLQPHIQKHSSIMGFRNGAEYERAAVEFMESPLSECSEEIFMQDGRRCRVDHEKGWMGIVNADGTMKTFYDPGQFGETTVDAMNKWIKESRKDARRTK